MEDIAFRTFIGFCACLAFAVVSVIVYFLCVWFGWWLLIGMVGLFMLLCLFYGVGHVLEKLVD